MDQRQYELEDLVRSIADRRRTIDSLEKNLRTLNESVAELQGKAKLLRDAQASETAQMCALALALTTRPEPPTRKSRTVTGTMASSYVVAGPGGEEDTDASGSVDTPPQHSQPNRRPRWRRFRRRGVPAHGQAALATRTTSSRTGPKAARGAAEHVLRLRIPSLVTMSEAKAEAILRGRARGISKRVDLGFRHRSPRVRCFSVVRPATVPFRADPGGNAPRGFAMAVRELAHRSIRKAGRPLDRNAIVELVKKSGMPLPRDNLARKVSKILLEDAALVNVRGSGYTLRAEQEV